MEDPFTGKALLSNRRAIPELLVVMKRKKRLRFTNRFLKPTLEGKEWYLYNVYCKKLHPYDGSMKTMEGLVNSYDVHENILLIPR
jgi:hypothetical protein